MFFPSSTPPSSSLPPSLHNIMLPISFSLKENEQIKTKYHQEKLSNQNKTKGHRS